MARVSHPSALRVVPLPAREPEQPPNPSVQLVVNLNDLLHTISQAVTELQASMVAIQTELAAAVQGVGDRIEGMDLRVEVPPPLAAAEGPTASDLHVIALLEEIRRSITAPRTRTVERNSHGEITVVHEEVSGA